MSEFRSRALEGVGVAAQLANVAISAIESKVLPRSLINPTLPDADFFVLQGADTRRGAATVDRLVKRAQFAPVEYDALRPSRPMLRRTRLTVNDPTDVHQLEVQATAPGGNWAADSNRAGHVAIYVNGRYHSDLLVMAERDAAYRVNLAGLAPGEHEVELRWSKDLDPTSVQPHVRAVRSARITGDDALVARFAPMIETRASRVVNGTVEQPVLSTDIPMVMAPTVEQLPDGGKRITYDLLISNEDGGVDVSHAYRQLGRTIDQEIAYRVTLDAQGKRVSDMFQGPVHVPYSYKGERIGERPILSVGTRNNMFTSRAMPVAPRWSEAPVGITAQRRSDRDLLVDHPWTTAVMGKELEHEGKVNPTGKRPVYDARRYLFIGGDDAVRQALRGAGLVHLRMRDGSILPFDPKTIARSIPFPFAPPMGTAVALPANVESDAIAGIVELAGQKTRSTFVLNENYHARVLTDGLEPPAAATR